MKIPSLSAGVLLRTLWRWHFYAGLFVLPFVLVLALSGTVFLFKPQIDRWEERAFQGLPITGTATPTRQVEAALAAFPGARFHNYRLPERADDAAMIQLALPEPGAMRDVFVSAQGIVLGRLDTRKRIVEVARRSHGQLLLGQRGSWVVELVACWAIVMLITGLFLWWPRGRGAAGVIWPRRSALLRDLHAVTGFWVTGFALLLLLTGLPWTDVWGNAFAAVRTEMGWVKGVPQWSTSGDAPAQPEHTSHDNAAMHAGHASHESLALLDAIVTRAAAESLAFPAVVMAPGAALFGPASPDWVVTSNTQNRPLGGTITFSSMNAAEISRERFADRHPIDRVVGYGLAWHEGALFGVINQIIGLLTAAALITMSVTGFLMWRRRKPADALGAPPLPSDRRQPLFVTMATLTLALLLPMLAASLLLLWLVDLLLPHVSPKAAAWLGLTASSRIATP